jgi:hypothetical protein
MPFTSNLLGEYGNNPLAVNIFAVNQLLATLATQATLLYGRRRDVMIAPHAAEVWERRARVAAMVFAVALSIGLAWVNTSAAKWCGLLIPLAPWGTNRWSAPDQFWQQRGPYTRPVARLAPAAEAPRSLGQQTPGKPGSNRAEPLCS